MVVARRAGDAGAQVAAAGDFAAKLGLMLYLPTCLFALHLFGLRAGLAAMDADEVPGRWCRRCREKSMRGMLREVGRHMVKDRVELVSTLLWYLAFAGYWMEHHSLEKGSYQRLGAALLDVGLMGVGVLSCCFVFPRWVLEWRTLGRSIRPA